MHQLLLAPRRPPPSLARQPQLLALASVSLHRLAVGLEQHLPTEPLVLRLATLAPLRLAILAPALHLATLALLCLAIQSVVHPPRLALVPLHRALVPAPGSVPARKVLAPARKLAPGLELQGALGRQHNSQLVKYAGNLCMHLFPVSLAACCSRRSGVAASAGLLPLGKPAMRLRKASAHALLVRSGSPNLASAAARSGFGQSGETPLRMASLHLSQTTSQQVLRAIPALEQSPSRVAALADRVAALAESPSRAAALEQSPSRVVALGQSPSRAAALADRVVALAESHSRVVALEQSQGRAQALVDNRKLATHHLEHRKLACSITSCASGDGMFS